MEVREYHGRTFVWLARGDREECELTNRVLGKEFKRIVFDPVESMDALVAYIECLLRTDDGDAIEDGMLIVGGARGLAGRGNSGGRATYYDPPAACVANTVRKLQWERERQEANDGN